MSFLSGGTNLFATRGLSESPESSLETSDSSESSEKEKSSSSEIATLRCSGKIE